MSWNCDRAGDKCPVCGGYLDNPGNWIKARCISCGGVFGRASDVERQEWRKRGAQKYVKVALEKPGVSNAQSAVRAR